jgi:hypothetical protein
VAARIPRTRARPFSDVDADGQEMLIHLQVRRFSCRNSASAGPAGQERADFRDLVDRFKVITKRVSPRLPPGAQEPPSFGRYRPCSGHCQRQPVRSRTDGAVRDWAGQLLRLDTVSTHRPCGDYQTG